MTQLDQFVPGDLVTLDAVGHPMGDARFSSHLSDWTQYYTGRYAKERTWNCQHIRKNEQFMCMVVASGPAALFMTEMDRDETGVSLGIADEFVSFATASVVLFVDHIITSAPGTKTRWHARPSDDPHDRFKGLPFVFLISHRRFAKPRKVL